MPPLLNHCQWWLTNKQIAKTHLGHARRLLFRHDPSDAHAAIALLDSALQLWPHWERALELKARTLLGLRQFKEVVYMLHDCLPSFRLARSAPAPASPLSEDDAQLLHRDDDLRRRAFSCLAQLALSGVKKTLGMKLPRKVGSDEWRFMVLGQACCHLGLMEDALLLLQRGKLAACAAARKRSNRMKEDGFRLQSATSSDEDVMAHMLSNVKALLRRRAAALASLEAGLFTDSIRHFTKIVDGKRGAPQGFIAQCYMQRAMAYQGAGRVADAIADCNRALALNPKSMEALHARASLYEMIRCYADCLHDLEQLKLLYETQLRCPRMEATWPPSPSPHATNTELQENLELMKRRIMAIRKRLTSQDVADYQRLLGLPRACSRADAERGHLLLSLKHRPERAAHFVDRCELVDSREVETIREAAGSSALKLFQLIQEAYTGVLSAMVEEEMKRQQKQEWGGCLQGVSYGGSCEDGMGREGEEEEEEMVDEGGGGSRSLVVLSLASPSCPNQSLPFLPLSTCRELAKESWMGSTQWPHHHHHHHHPLTVT